MSTVRSVVRSVVFAALAGSVVAAQPALAQTTLTMSSWVSPTHHITAVVLQGWANEAEKVTNGRVKFQMLPKHPSCRAGPRGAWAASGTSRGGAGHGRPREGPDAAHAPLGPAR